MQEGFNITREKTVGMRKNMKFSDASWGSGLRRRSYSASQSIRILADYGQMRSSETSDRIQDIIMPKAIAELQRRISVTTPVTGVFHLPVLCLNWWTTSDGKIYCINHDSTPRYPGYCSFSDLGVTHNPQYLGGYQRCSGPYADTCTDYPREFRQSLIYSCPAEQTAVAVCRPADSACLLLLFTAQEGVANTDFILYVVSSETGCTSSTLAYAGACKQDPVTGRPLAGYVSTLSWFCYPFLWPADPHSSAQHILAFFCLRIICKHCTFICFLTPQHVLLHLLFHLIR